MVVRRSAFFPECAAALHANARNGDGKTAYAPAARGYRLARAAQAGSLSRPGRQKQPDLATGCAIIRRSEAEARQAALYPNPTVGYEGDQIRGGSYGGGEQGGFFAQTIVLGGKLGLRRNIYEQQKQSDTIAAQVQLLRVHNDVTQMFYNALSAQRTVEVRGRLAALAAEAAQTTHRLANVGQADAPDVLQAEVE